MNDLIEFQYQYDKNNRPHTASGAENQDTVKLNFRLRKVRSRYRCSD